MVSTVKEVSCIVQFRKFIYYSCAISLTIFVSVGCSGEADVVFLLDRSGSVRNERFPFVLQYIVNVVSQMDVGSSKTRVGVVSFADNARVEFLLNSYTTKQDTVMVNLTEPGSIILPLQCVKPQLECVLIAIVQLRIFYYYDFV